MAALQHAGIYGVLAAGLVLACGHWRATPALLLILAATLLARASGFGMAFISKSFAGGFGATAGDLGLVVLAASCVAALAAESGAAARLARACAGRLGALAPALGLLAGLGGSPAAALAVLSPVLGAAGNSRSTVLRAATAISASHGLILPSPVMIAAVTILGADWHRTLALGVPGAVLLAALGACVLHALPALDEAPPPAAPRGSKVAAFGLCLAVLTMTGMLILRAVGDFPSEPLGGGPARELALAMGRGLPLLLAGGAIMLQAGLRWPPAAPLSRGLAEDGWAGAAMAQAAPLILLLAAAGGLQSVAMDTHMAPVLAERLAGLPGLGLAAPFLMAALFKLLMGNSLTAAISTAGILLPFLAPLGLGSDAGRVLAALAVGAGSMAATNVNDPFFWLAASLARLPPPQAVLRLTLVTAIQAVCCLALLYAAGLIMLPHGR